MKSFLAAIAFLVWALPVFAAEVPDEDEIQALSDKVLLDWNKAMLQADFAAFFKNDCAKLWQEQTSAEKLHEQFSKQFGGQKIDFSGAIKEMEPHFEPAPEITKVGTFEVLNIKGYYDTKPNRFSFGLKFVQEGGKWKLIGISVTAKPEPEE